MRGRNGDVSNIMVNLQHDVGQWCTEYTWSAEDSMWGVRVLHNFGRIGPSADPLEDSEKSLSPTPGSCVKRVDEEDAIEGGLKGRVSVGAEFYFSAKEKSAGGQYSVLELPGLLTGRCLQYRPVFGLQLFQMQHLHPFKYQTLRHRSRVFRKVHLHSPRRLSRPYSTRC